MKTLPFELLTFIFSHLAKSDILQCQLTCKSWHEASTKHLYSKVVINTDDKSFLFVRTLLNSFHLGNYVQDIFTEKLFRTKTDGTFWDQRRLLNTLIKQCPNLSVINADDPDLSFYARILYAASQGQLSRLCVLPFPYSSSLESYIYTALLFKSSLTTIVLQDNERYFGPDLNQLEAYQTLKDQIHEFEHLEDLGFYYLSNKRLSQFDEIIEDCPNLKRITIELDSEDERGQIVNFEGVINPRPDINELECNWEQIDDGIQLRYVVRKFPNLKSLTVRNENADRFTAIHIACDDLIMFLCYAVVIPSFSMIININKQQLSKVWFELMKVDDKFRDITFEYVSIYDEIGEIDLKFDSKTTEISFPFDEDEVELAHINFFSKVGSMVRTLNIQGSMGSSRWDIFYDIDWIFQTLQLCPSLHALTISGCPYKIQPNYRLSQHPQVRNLFIDRINREDSTEFFKQLSLSFPNLACLRLSYFGNRINKRDLDVIFMPNSRLDMLVLDNLPFSRHYECTTIEFYIKLDLDTGLKFFKCNSQTGVLAVDELHYNLSKTNDRIEINCLSLARLVINNSDHNTNEKLLDLCSLLI